MALAQLGGLRTSVEEDVVPAIDLVDDSKRSAAPLGKLLDGFLPIRFGQEQLTQGPHVVKEQRRAVTLGRIWGSRCIADEHYFVAGNVAGPDIVIGKEANWSLLFDVLENSLRRVAGG